MRTTTAITRQTAAGAAMALTAGAAACGAEAVRAHLWLSSLGPICGLERPDLFFLHCPACPAGLAFLAGALVFGGLAVRAPAHLAEPAGMTPPPSKPAAPRPGRPAPDRSPPRLKSLLQWLLERLCMYPSGD